MQVLLLSLDGRAEAFSSAPIVLACPREKMGRYSAIKIVTTTTPMTIRIAGSMRASEAVSAVCTSSSKNSATEFSICGNAPVDSPTSIISVDSSGKTFVLSGLRQSFSFPHTGH